MTTSSDLTALLSSDLTDETTRLVLADALTDSGRDDESALCRDLAVRVAVTDGAVTTLARHAGTTVGRAMARDVLADDLPRAWDGLGAEDADALSADIGVASEEWDEAVEAAEAAYLAALREADRVTAA